jgi:hypothetical protein
VSRHTSADRWLGTALFLAAVACVAALPHHLGESDESLLLYETLRIMRGEVFYRDIFNNIAPGAHLVFLTLFAIFGASITTARLAIAVVHGLIAVIIYACCRRLGVRRGLGAAAALAHLALAQPAFPYASPHWLSALLGVALLLAALRRPWAARTPGAAWLGVIAGLLTAVHHQRGVILLPGAVAVLVADWLVTWRCSGREPARTLLRRLQWLLGAYAAVVVPFFAALLWWAGVGPVWAALVEFPLVHYRRFNQTPPWGAVNLLTAPLAAYTLPRLLAWLPLALLPVGTGGLVRAWRRAPGEAPQRPIALVVVGLFTLASTLYFPDFIHLAFIAPVLIVALATDVEWGLAALGATTRPKRKSAARFGVRAAVVLLLLVLAAKIGANLRRSQRDFAVRVETPFGRIALRSAATAELVATIRTLANAAPNRQMFVYPGYPALYLMTGTDNPTPFQILLPGYNPPQALAAARVGLQIKRVPLVVLVHAAIAADDPILRYVREHYDPVGASAAVPGAPAVYQRRAGE